MVGSVRGFVFIAVLFVSSLLYATTLLFPATVLLIPLVPRPVYRRARRAYRRWTGWVGYLFLAMAAYLLENFCNIKVKITGDRVPFGEAALIISNHRTRVDWMFLWCLCLRQGQLSGLKIVLKESLKGIPGFGWATQMLLFVFLARNKAKDVRRVREISEYLVGLNAASTLLIFPEGTDLSPSNHEKSIQFAKKEGLAEYQYLLHPKVRGFAECLRALRPGLDAVHDVTIAYHNFNDGGPPSEKTMLAGRFPREVHMHVRRHAMKDLPTSEDGLEEWCREAFREKEARLQAFHEGPRTFQDAEVQEGSSGRVRATRGSDDDEEEASSRRSGLMALLFFLALVLLVLVYGGTIFAWYALTACCVCTIATAFGGWDTLELWWSEFSLQPSGELKQD